MDVVGEGQCPSPYACVPQSSVLNAATLAVVIVYRVTNKFCPIGLIKCSSFLKNQIDQ